MHFCGDSCYASPATTGCCCTQVKQSIPARSCKYLFKSHFLGMDTRKFETSGVRPRPKTYAYVTVGRTGHGQLCAVHRLNKTVWSKNKCFILLIITFFLVQLHTNSANVYSVPARSTYWQIGVYSTIRQSVMYCGHVTSDVFLSRNIVEVTPIFFIFMI